MMARAKVCLDCLDLVLNLDQPRCPECTTIRTREINAARPHQRGKSFVRMAAVAARARRDATVVCWLCGSREPPEIYDGEWTADHVTPGEVNSELRPAHRGCNAARGNRGVYEFRAQLVDRLPDWTF